MYLEKTDTIKHVLILVDRFDSLGGIQKWANQIATEFQRRGYQTHLIALTRSPVETAIDYGRDKKIRTVTLLDSDSHQAYKGTIGEIRKVAGKLPTGVIMKIDTLLSGWRPTNLNQLAISRLKDELNSFKGNAIIIATSEILLNHLNATGLSIGKNSDTPLLAQYHNDFRFVARRRKGLAQFKKSYKNANRVVFLTESDKELARTLGIENAEVIPNPRPTIAHDHSLIEKKKIAVALGRLERQKSFEYLLYTWRVIKDHHPEWKLYIYGSGPQERRLQKLIKKLDLMDFVFLKGVTNEPLKVFSEASIHLLSSQYEGWALTISEAASVRTPTIAFDSGPGIRAQISSGANGILVEKNNTASYIDAVRRVLSDPEFLGRMSEQALNDSARFEITKVAEYWEKLFRDVKR